MAGRYVILSFDDRDAAEAFVTNPHLPDQLGFDIEAMYLKPNKHCTCYGEGNAKVPQHAWLKHPKYGLYVCRVCKRPSQFHNRGILERLQYAFGYTMITRGVRR